MTSDQQGAAPTDAADGGALQDGGSVAAGRTAPRLRILGVAALLLALLAAMFVAGQAAGGQAQATGAADGEQLHVTGDWVVDVSDPDGTVVATHEFANALTTRGRSELLRALSGSPVDHWAVTVNAEPRASCREDGSTDSGLAFCHLYTPNASQTDGFGEAEVAREDGKLVLRARFVPLVDARITSVGTNIYRCNAPHEVTECPPTSIDGGAFTRRNLPGEDSIDIEAGRTADVVVRIGID